MLDDVGHHRTAGLSGAAGVQRLPRLRQPAQLVGHTSQPEGVWTETIETPYDWCPAHGVTHLQSSLCKPSCDSRGAVNTEISSTPCRERGADSVPLLHHPPFHFSRATWPKNTLGHQDTLLCRERRCHCLMIVCCCNCYSGRKRDQHRPAYAAMGELFSQVRLQGAKHL